MAVAFHQVQRTRNHNAQQQQEDDKAYYNVYILSRRDGYPPVKYDYIVGYGIIDYVPPQEWEIDMSIPVFGIKKADWLARQIVTGTRGKASKLAKAQWLRDTYMPPGGIM